jgi:hypothetical protein
MEAEEETMASVPVPSTQESLLDVARRRWRPVVVGVVLGLLAAGASIVVAGPRWTSEASVLVTPTGVADAGQVANGQSSSSQLNLQTEAELVTSTAVTDRIRSTPGTDLSTEDLIEAVGIEVPPNTPSCRSPIPATRPARPGRGPRPSPRPTWPLARPAPRTRSASRWRP